MNKAFTAQLPHVAKPALTQRKPPRHMQPSVDPAQVGQQITQILLNSAELDTVLSKMAATLTDAFGGAGCLVAILEGEQLCAHVTAWPENSQSEQLVSESIAFWDCPLLRRRLTGNKPLAIADIQEIKVSQLIATKCRVLGVRSILAIPTRFQGNMNGVVVIMRRQAQNWTVREQELIEAVADPIAIAISHVMQTQTLQMLQHRDRTFTHQQALIARLTKVIQNSLDLTQILQEAVEGITQTLEVNHGIVMLLKYTSFKDLAPSSIYDSANRSSEGIDRESAHTPPIPEAKVTVVGQWLISSEGSVVSVSATSGKLNSLPPGLTHFNQSFAISDCALCQQAFQAAPQPLAIAHQDEFPVSEPSETKAKLAPIFQPEVMPAVLIAPLLSSNERTKGSILGFLVLQNTRPRTWNAEELELVKLVSNQLSNALIQARTLHKVHTIVGDRTDQLRRSMDVQAKLYEQTRRQIEQLRFLNQQKDEFLSAISHELNTPLASMGVAIQMLRQSSLSPERQAKYLNILEQEWRRETNLVNDLLMLQRLESQNTDLQFQPLDLAELIGEVGQSFEQRWAQKKLKLSVKLLRPSLKLQSDADSLKRILEELLTNAGKYSNPGTTVTCEVSEQAQTTKQFVLTLTNIAPTISPEDLSRIFDKFHRGSGATQQAIAGTGLGLALVQGLVQLLQGTIEASSHPTKDPKTSEMCFRLTLPQMLNNSMLDGSV